MNIRSQNQNKLLFKAAQYTYKYCIRYTRFLECFALFYFSTFHFALFCIIATLCLILPYSCILLYLYNIKYFTKYTKYILSYYNIRHILPYFYESIKSNTIYIAYKINSTLIQVNTFQRIFTKHLKNNIQIIATLNKEINKNTTHFIHRYILPHFYESIKYITI